MTFLWIFTKVLVQNRNTSESCVRLSKSNLHIGSTCVFSQKQTSPNQVVGYYTPISHNIKTAESWSEWQWSPHYNGGFCYENLHPVIHVDATWRTRIPPLHQHTMTASPCRSVIAAKPQLFTNCQRNMTKRSRHWCGYRILLLQI